ncbi:MAG: hypothetical protein AB1861_07755 [Cyanobacteriota bacterium]
MIYITGMRDRRVVKLPQKLLNLSQSPAYIKENLTRQQLSE